MLADALAALTRDTDAARDLALREIWNQVRSLVRYRVGVRIQEQVQARVLSPVQSRNMWPVRDQILARARRQALEQLKAAVNNNQRGDARGG